MKTNFDRYIFYINNNGKTQKMFVIETNLEDAKKEALRKMPLNAFITDYYVYPFFQIAGELPCQHMNLR